jgi:DNA-binding NarL/FixJ family response regulator
MCPAPIIAVMIVTNHPIMGDGLRLRVQHEPDMRAVCVASDLARALRELELHRPDVAVIDLQSPPGAALQAIKAIRKVSPGTPVVILTDYPGDIDASLHTVAVSKTLASEQVIRAIRAAIAAP